jgi:hypothetical protein
MSSIIYGADFVHGFEEPLSVENECKVCAKPSKCHLSSTVCPYRDINTSKKL